MPKVAIDIALPEIERLLVRLDARTQERLMHRMASAQVRALAGRLRRHVRRRGLTQKAIHRISESVRQAYHDRSHS